MEALGGIASHARTLPGKMLHVAEIAHLMRDAHSRRAPYYGTPISPNTSHRCPTRGQDCALLARVCMYVQQCAVHKHTLTDGRAALATRSAPRCIHLYLSLYIYIYFFLFSIQICTLYIYIYNKKGLMDVRTPGRSMPIQEYPNIS
jgi:hypothetical protein